MELVTKYRSCVDGVRNTGGITIRFLQLFESSNKESMATTTAEKNVRILDCVSDVNQSWACDITKYRRRPNQDDIEFSNTIGFFSNLME
jgi:hypothetical protein